MYRLKSFAKKITPPKIWKLLSFVWNPRQGARSVYYYYLIKTAPKRHKKALEKARKKDIIKVAFFLIHDSIWKYDGVYHLMEKDHRFDPVVVVCPNKKYGEEIMLKNMNQAYNSFRNNGYNVVKSLNENTGEWLDVKKEINPDIVFFTNPWNLTNKEYTILSFHNYLTCYVPYFFHVTKHLKENYGGLLQNLIWKAYYETGFHKDFAKTFSKNKASNVVVTGYPGLDPFFANQETNDDPWKIKDRKIKRIIWAPHHSIEGQDSGLSYSNFNKYATFFLNLALKKTKDLQLAFKPHPLLKPKLYKDQNWGKEKTNEYFKKWQTLENGILCESDYKSLFLTSNAMIHDSGSFIVEYLSTGKPCLYTMHDKDVKSRLNGFGQLALNQHYHAFEESGIVEFINNIVLKCNDYKKAERLFFIHNHLSPPKSKTAANNIFNDICNSLTIDK